MLILPLLLSVVFCSTAWTNEWPPSPKGKKAKAVTELFQGARILEIEIEISKEGIDELAGSKWNFGMTRGPRPKVIAVLKEGGQVYPDVSIHLKGAAGSFRSLDDRPALTLNFDKTDEEQRFHGLKKIHLNNSVQDPTYLNEKDLPGAVPKGWSACPEGGPYHRKTQWQGSGNVCSGRRIQSAVCEKVFQ
jgi:hypothetical protein